MGKIIQIQKPGKKLVASNRGGKSGHVVKYARPMIRKVTSPDGHRPRIRFRPRQDAALSVNQAQAFFAASKRYSLVHQVGSGGMAEIFKAHDSLLNLHVALKFLPREMMNDNNAVDAFRNEARTVMQLSHKNIVKLHTLDVSEGAMFLVMEFVDGRNFAEIISQMGRLKLASVVQIMHSCAAAIDYAHKCGVLHKDLKPANLMLTSDSVLKIVDFGIARHVAEDETDGQNLFIEGTYPYMSPEQYECKTLDHRTDIYSLAAVVYELLAGHPILPFDGNPVEILTAGLKPVAGIPDAAWIAIRKALSKERGERWNSAGDFYTALEDAIEPEGAG